MVERFEIVVVQFEWRDKNERRPVVVLSPKWYLDTERRQDVMVAPISSATDLFDERRHLLIRDDDPEFAGTGLQRTSYVALDYITHVGRTELGRSVGRLGRNLAEALVKRAVEFLTDHAAIRRSPPQKTD